MKERLTAQEKLAREWWEEWTRSYFPTLVPRTKWKSSSRNVQDGDIALLRYTTKYTAPSYRLCRVVGVKTGEDGQVRSCEVAMRPRRKGEDQEARYQQKKLATLTVGVQRIVVILPMEEQEGEEGGRNQLQEEPGAEKGSYRPEEESQRVQTSQIHDGPVQGGASPKGREEPLRREQPRRSCRERNI